MKCADVFESCFNDYFECIKLTTVLTARLSGIVSVLARVGQHWGGATRLLMPGEDSPKASNRWEGTHTYKKPEATKRRARTVAQLREEAAAKSKANREEAINRRRGSIGGQGTTRTSAASTEAATPDSRGSPTTSAAAPNKTLLSRRGSTGGILSNIATPAPGENDGQRGQEQEMPGSAKKKRNGSGAKQGEGEDGEGVDPALLRFLTSMKNDLMNSTKEAVTRIESKLERHENSIANLERRVERSENEMAARIASEVAKQCTVGASTAPGPPAGKGSKHEAAYHFCRRSLKLWPVVGEELEDAVKTFLKTKLGMTDGRIRALGAIEVSAVAGRAARERKEVLATFETKEDRDSVKANGVNLAGQREVGMSIHVPGHLMDSMVALNGLGYSIKQKKPDTKRAVKFDDARQDLYLDICIDGIWKRIGPKEARQVLKEVPASGATSLSITVAELTNIIKDKTEESNVVVIPDDTMET